MLSYGYKIARRNRFYETGESFVLELKNNNFDCILDLGCGENLYKDVDNLIGIDLASKEADIVADISNLPYSNNSVDCILAFGSLISRDIDELKNIDSKDILDSQFKEIHRVLRSEGILFARSSYLDIIDLDCLNYYETKYGFGRLEAKYIINKDLKTERLFWKWKKLT